MQAVTSFPVVEAFHTILFTQKYFALNFATIIPNVNSIFVYFISSVHKTGDKTSKRASKEEKISADNTFGVII